MSRKEGISNLAKNEIFVPRSNLQRTLVYHPNVKWGYQLANVFAVVMFLPALFDAFELYSKGNEMAALALALVGALLPVFFFQIARSTLKPLVSMKVHVQPDRLKMEKSDESVEISFDEIEAVTLSFLPYLGGWFYIHLRSGESHKFTVALQRSEYILEAIMNFNPQLFTREKFESYRRTAVSAEHTGARFVAIVKNWKSLGLRYVVVPLLGAFVLSHPIFFVAKEFKIKTLFSLMELLIFLNYALGMLIWIASEFVLIRRTRAILRESPSAVVRDVVYETNLLKKAAKIHTGVFSFFALSPIAILGLLHLVHLISKLFNT